MKNFLSYLLLFIFLLLQGCIQAPNNTRKSTLSASSTSTPSGNTATGLGIYPTFAVDENLYWFSSSKIVGTVVINKNSQDVVYLRGKLVHDFLNAINLSGTEYFRKQYCLEGNFSSTAYKKVRLRAIPIYVTTSTNAIERLLRIDVPNATDSLSACKDTTATPVATATATTAFSLPDICPSCTGQVTTTSINLFDSTAASLVKIAPTLMDLSTLFFKADLTSNSTSPSTSCTTSSCSAKGFDCCISGQCVNDATEKTSAKSDPQYNQALIDYAANPLSFINYPNIYNICTNISHIPPTTTTPVTTTPTSDAVARVALYLTDYTCISDVIAGNGYANCRILNSLLPPKSNTTAIDKSQTAYTVIKKKLAIACGCTAASDQTRDLLCITDVSAGLGYNNCRNVDASGVATGIDKTAAAFAAIKISLGTVDNQMAVKCPDWGIVPVYLSGALQTNANITDFACYTPQPANQVGPITNLNVSVSNRSAPHRFYSSSGTNFDDLTGLQTKSPNTIQEGDDFYYLDELNKMSPVNGAFNINSVLGKMTIDLSHAIPAKEVTVELGKTYIISATSGFFTACSKCARDSWFQTFTAFPATQRGMGLQATGYTTSRDSYSANSSLGNYEDTKFGRACYVPVTMLPLSHKKNTSLQIQRQNRLKTQTAYYVNGYQRDWFGFNKGALIGSYDGVTWFAIGTGRRTTATSTKLFLALNASFLDLVDKNDTLVNIIPDFSANTAADFDYDPDLALTDPRQNSAATCQKFHQCAVDADCVSQLGWEYVCADVSQFKTAWPQYDGDANESANQETSSTLFSILQSTISTSNGKRCIYRGAGAPCKRDYSSLSVYNKKPLTCAPNFYCAPLTTNKFNEQLVRSPNELSDILFGMDTKILGRPLNYVTAGKGLATEIITNIKYNATVAIGLSSVDSDDMGICRPGKLLVSNEIQAHSNPDLGKRTDYISQIGSCSSGAGTTGGGPARFNTCPAFDDTLNYVDASAVTAAYVLTQKQTQNSCGAESKDKTSPYVSAFKNIEGLSLLNLQNISQPILAQDACLRRAGSVCNTDLDCGPNIMHENSVSTTDLKYFGGTDGEMQYWKESLICGQATSAPVLGSVGYFDYKLSDNRCCREIGKDFTMITQGPKSIVPENSGTNINLVTSKLAFSDPTAINRYSRYTISKIANNDSTKFPAVSASVEPSTNQWQVINETGALTCCGGGWIRKFTDGSHDWKIRNRLTIDASNFSCLNFRSPLANSNYNPSTAGDYVVPASYQREVESFCKSPDGTGCLQITYPDTNNFVILSPTPYDPASKISDPLLAGPVSGLTRLDTTPNVDPIANANWVQDKRYSDVPYMPNPYYFLPVSLDVNPKTFEAYSFFSNKPTDYGVEFYLPAYLGWDANPGIPGPPPAVATLIADPTFIKKVYIKYFYDNAPTVVVDITNNLASAAECTAVINSVGGYPVDSMSFDNTWCIVNNAKTQYRPVFIAKADSNPLDGNTWKYAGIVIDFKPVEQFRGTPVATPGNALYYLSKLARLELLGIPQITYEPLYCNNNQNNLVPGIFKSTALVPIKTRANFASIVTPVSIKYTGADPIDRYNADSSTESYDSFAGYGNNEQRFTYQDKIDHPAVFSSKDFTCCTPLGKSTASGAKCCSGHAILNSDKVTSTCKLPSGTDLNVYFNKFVSNEGVGIDQPEQGLKTTAPDDVDFNPYTGEPKFRASTYKILSELGTLYCDGSAVVLGGAFGKFPPEPFSGTYEVKQGASGSVESLFPESIVDSIIDFQASDPTLGKVPFDSGFKWNHHYYCK